MPARERVRHIYIIVMSVVGVLLLAAGLWRVPGYEEPLIFLALIILAVLAQVASTSHAITYEVGAAISLAATPQFGPFGAAAVVIFSHAGFWVFNNARFFPGWKRSMEQIGFNSGMHGLSVFLAGITLTITATWWGEQNPLGQVFPWFLAAIVGDQINIWLLILMVYLQHNVRPQEVWWSNRWAMPINVLVTAVGGGVLAFAIRALGLIGLGVFFLPVLLSAYAFRVFVNRTKEQMAHLEELVQVRTRDLADSNAALAELNKQKDAFLAVLTHDMRSPLTSIQGYASLLHDYPDLSSEKRKEIAAIILRNEQALLEIVENILEIEQLQSGAPVMLEHETFDLRGLILEVVQSVRAKSAEKEIDLIYELGEQPIYLNADRPKVRRVLQNLLTNAVKYTPERGRVSVVARMNGQDTYIEVADTGYGIPAGELPYIFDRYRRVAKHRDKATGTGLGLAIVQSLVEAHDGEVCVTSEEGVGSEFVVRLPLNGQQGLPA